MMNIERREEKGNWLQHLVTKAIILKPPYFGSKSDYEYIFMAIQSIYFKLNFMD